MGASSSAPAAQAGSLSGPTPSGRSGGAVLLIGSPSVGKAQLGSLLARTQAGGTARFLSVGDELRSRALVGDEDVVAPRAADLRTDAKDILRAAAQDWAARQKTGLPGAPPPLLLLDCVYETEDAFAVMEVLREAGVPLLQVLYLHHNALSASAPYDVYRPHGDEAQAKWSAHAGRVLEFFSALGLLTEVPVTSPRLVTSRSERDRVLAEAARVSGLRLDGFFRGASSGGPALPEPTRALASAADARWVGWPGRYAVSRKAEGTRHLLMVLQGQEGEAEGKAEAYLLNGVGSLYRFPIQTLSPGPASRLTAGQGEACLPPGTLLDGELMPLRERLAAMEGGGGGDGGGLGLTEAEECRELHAAASMRGFPLATSEALLKRQQGPPLFADDTLCVLRKRHVPVSREARQLLQESLPSCPYPTGGLAFTPYDMPYVLGMAELSYTWQPPDKRVVLLAGPEARAKAEARRVSGGADMRRVLLQDLVYECVTGPSPMKPQHSLWEQRGGSYASWGARLQLLAEARARGGASEELYSWTKPVDIRWDLAGGDSREEQLAQARERGLTAEELARAAAEAAAEAAAFGAAAQPPAPQPHPARRMPFDELYGSVMAAVEAGGVERSVDPGSGLELFDCRPGSEAASEVEALCRGLVLHPPSRTVVAAPFGPLGEPSRPPPAAPHQPAAPPARRPAKGKDWHSVAFRAPLVTVTLLPETEAELRALSSGGGGTACPDAPASASGGADTSAGGSGGAPLCSASVKVDGCLVLAFTWGGQLRTATRRGMEAEQALWAGDWLRRNANPAAFQPGWSHMLEAVYGSSTHVVPYAFEGLVLLGAVDSAGLEVPRLRLPALAQDLGVTLAAPSLEGRLSDLLSGLPGADPGPGAGGKLPPLASPPAFEGWVVAGPDSRRYKLVQLPYKQVSVAGRLLHPLSVWDRVCYGGATPASLATGLPEHMRSELYGILSALSEAYGRARAALRRRLSSAAMARWLPALGLEELLKEFVALVAAADAGGEAGAAAASGLQEVVAEFHKLTRGLPHPAPAEASGEAGAGPARPVPMPFLRALAHALSGYNHAPTSITYIYNHSNDHVPTSIFYNHSSVPYFLSPLRGLLLRCVQPGLDGSLRGYTPSPAFAHSWARAWAQGPVVISTPPAPIHTALPDELLERCLAPLDGMDLIAAASVCVKWRRVMERALPPGDLASRLAAGRQAVEAAAAEVVAAARAAAARVAAAEAAAAEEAELQAALAAVAAAEAAAAQAAAAAVV
ncbi:hypothetical protein HYH03_005443 [Edaphochlamys debaryana]|uniref:F-box domain-containing protein n=1 Tax=Edaphochlamys debaryana TaxID=47281 RepID=A0A835Y593_9CHLO|nr:hypothetical protein HYH03_005443 [Edaphochlamys debaryana]|eukprot:KAG2496622.1 hypothetical protein HYH03_005443 [Edaphochlamys debaryana]